MTTPVDPGDAGEKALTDALAFRGEDVPAVEVREKVEQWANGPDGPRDPNTISLDIARLLMDRDNTWTDIVAELKL